MSNIAQVIESFNHTRKFGLELECFGLTRAEVKALLVANNIPAWGYNDAHDGTPCWRVCSDGSIDTYGRGESVELVSPILSGREGLRQVAQVVKLMADAGARVNKSCGFHVHVNARDISGASITNIVRRYARHEAAIDSFMVHSRRGSNNGYCRSTAAIVSRFSTVAVNATAESMASLASRENYDEVTGQYAGGRYHKINLCAFLRHGTVEFRHHGGTMSPSKVINWIAFCVTFFENSMASDAEDLFAGMDPSMVTFFNERAAALATPPVVRPMRRR